MENSGRERWIVIGLLAVAYFVIGMWVEYPAAVRDIAIFPMLIIGIGVIAYLLKYQLNLLLILVALLAVFGLFLAVNYLQDHVFGQEGSNVTITVASSEGAVVTEEPAARLEICDFSVAEGQDLTLGEYYTFQGPIQIYSGGRYVDLTENIERQVVAYIDYAFVLYWDEECVRYASTSSGGAYEKVDPSVFTKEGIVYVLEPTGGQK